MGVNLLLHLGEYPMLLDSFVLQDALPVCRMHFPSQSTNQAKVCPLEVQSGSSAATLLTSLGIKNNFSMITKPKTASSCPITNQPFSVPEQHVQWPFSLIALLTSCQELLCHAFQEPFGLFLLCSVVFPPVTCSIDVPHENKRL